MSTKKDSLLKIKSKKLEEILKYSDFVKGSLYKVQRKGKGDGDFYHLTYKDENQKTHTKYISEKERRKTEASLKSMKRVNKLINDISKINIELLKEE